MWNHISNTKPYISIEFKLALTYGYLVHVNIFKIEILLAKITAPNKNE